MPKIVEGQKWRARCTFYLRVENMSQVESRVRDCLESQGFNLIPYNTRNKSSWLTVNVFKGNDMVSLPAGWVKVHRCSSDGRYPRIHLILKAAKYQETRACVQVWAELHKDISRHLQEITENAGQECLIVAEALEKANRIPKFIPPTN